MYLRQSLMIAFFIFYRVTAFAQIENVIIETYYVSDANDATDTIGGFLEEGSTTYRIFIDLMPGSKILKVYGDEAHPLAFSSTQSFFNHHEDGVTFGKDFVRTRYEIGTVPVDTYLTLGQCSRSFGQGAYFGVPKHLDTDGSLVGGVHNDGGSQEIPTGLLINDSEQAGVPLTESDGLALSEQLPDSWIEIGFKDVLSGEDTTIFGSENTQTSFRSTQALLKNSGVQGVDPDSNIVLVAQLTTNGEIAFEINVELEIIQDGAPKILRYVAQNEQLSPGEIFEPLLNYPYECGCTDHRFLEASTSFVCSDNSNCITPVVFGCTDTLACNYKAEANFNIPELCCYIGFCHDQDINIVCPILLPRTSIDLEQVRLYPNPSSSDLYVVIESTRYDDILYMIYDLFGSKVTSGILVFQERSIQISKLKQGFYHLQFNIDGNRITLPFIKI